MSAIFDTVALMALLRESLASGLKTPIPIFDDESFLESRIRKHITLNEDVKSRFLEFLRTQPALEIFNNKSFNLGGGSWSGVSHESLIQWLLYSANKSGLDNVFARLEKYLSIDYTPAEEVLAISGVVVDNPTKLTDEIELVPFESLPPSLFKSRFDPATVFPNLPAGHTVDHAMSHAYKPPTAALRRRVELKPRVRNSQSHLEKLPPRDNALFDACECLTLLVRCSPLPIVHSYELDSWIPCYGFLSTGWSAPIHDVLNSRYCQLSSDQLVSASSICKKFLELDRDVRERLRVPIQRLNQARRRSDIADKAIELGIAFEALLLGDSGQKEQISFMFRLRGAWFLGENTADRLCLLETFKRIYELRSAAVHEGKLKPMVKIKNQGDIDASSFLAQAEDLCTRSILKIVELGKFPDWAKIILG